MANAPALKAGLSKGNVGSSPTPTAIKTQVYALKGEFYGLYLFDWLRIHLTRTNFGATICVCCSRA